MFIIISLFIAGIIGIPLGILNFWATMKNEKNAKIVAQQRYQAELKYREEMLKK